VGGTCGMHGGGERCLGVYRVLVWRPEGKRPLGRPRCRGGGSIILRWTLGRQGSMG